MSIFYLMPPRPFLGDRFAAFLQTIFPGLDWDRGARTGLADLLGAVALRGDVFVVYRDDLPGEESPMQALVNGFGAEVGDEVIEIRAGGRSGEMVARRWRIEAKEPLAA